MTGFDRCMPLKEAADVAGVHYQTLRKAIVARELEHVRRQSATGRRGRIYIRASALDKWLKRLTIPAARRSQEPDLAHV